MDAAGQPPTIRVVHESLVKSMDDNGYDPNRPLPGICIHYVSPEGIKANVAFNLEFSDRF